MKKTALGLFLSLPILTAATTVQAEDFGCKALLCFAGGMGISECQSTIKKVIRDMAKGHSFPHCTFSSSNGQGNNSGITTKLFTASNGGRRICPDGVTRAKKSGLGGLYTCKTIQINVSPELAVDENHKTQIYNYE